MFVCYKNVSGGIDTNETSASTAILNVKGVDYRYILRGINRNETVNILNIYVLEDKVVF